MEISNEVIGTALATVAAIAAGGWGWWLKQRGAQRADAVDSANAHAQISMLADMERRAKEAEAALSAKQQETITLERKLMQAEAKLYVAARDIMKLEHRLDEAGVPHSDYGSLIETNLGSLS